MVCCIVDLIYLKIFIYHWILSISFRAIPGEAKHESDDDDMEILGEPFEDPNLEPVAEVPMEVEAPSSGTKRKGKEIIVPVKKRHRPKLENENNDEVECVVTSSD